MIISSLERFARACEPPISNSATFLYLAPHCVPGGIRLVSGRAALRKLRCATVDHNLFPHSKRACRAPSPHTTGRNVAHTLALTTVNGTFSEISAVKPLTTFRTTV